MDNKISIILIAIAVLVFFIILIPSTLAIYRGTGGHWYAHDYEFCDLTNIDRLDDDSWKHEPGRPVTDQVEFPKTNTCRDPSLNVKGECYNDETLLTDYDWCLPEGAFGVYGCKQISECRLVGAWWGTDYTADTAFNCPGDQICFKGACQPPRALGEQCFYDCHCASGKCSPDTVGGKKVLFRTCIPPVRHENCCDNAGWDNVKRCGGCCPDGNCVGYHPSKIYYWHDSSEVWQCNYDPSQDSRYEFVEDCDDKDGWYGNCYRDYYCSGGSCKYNETCGCALCGDGTWNCTGGDNNHCQDNGELGFYAAPGCGFAGDARFWCGSNRWYSCSRSDSWGWVDGANLRPGQRRPDGVCCEPAKGAVPWGWCGDGFLSTACGEQCERDGDCGVDGWKDTGRRTWVSASDCTEKEQKEQDYYDYYCSNCGCGSNITNTRWVDTGTTKNKPNGTACGTDYYDSFVNYCSSDNVRKHRLFHDYYCTNGACTDHTSWVDDQLVENCNNRDGCVSTTYRDWYCSGGTCQYSDSSNDSRCIVCDCSSGPCCSDGCNFDASSRVCDTQSDYQCSSSACGADYQSRTRNRYCPGNSVNCTGSWGSWSAWSTVQDCNSLEKCYTSSPNCRYNASCEAAPSVDIKARPAGSGSYSDGPITINYNTAADLQWTSTNANSCTASGDWSGSKPTSGSQSTGNLTSDKNYTITCTGSGGSASDSVRVNVSSPGGPTVTLTANPPTINQGQSSTLSWSSTNATTCTASGGWSGGKATSGSQTVSPSSTTTYTLTCTGPGGSASDSATVTVIPPSAPSVTLTTNPSTINQGDSSRLSWTSTNTTTCTASGGWSGGKATSGAEWVSPSSTTTYTLTCTGPGGSASDSATVTVIVPVNDPPTATNLNRTDPNWCASPPAYFFRWIYSDPNGDNESRFDFQIDNNSNFSSPEVNRSYGGLSYGSGTQNSQSVLVATSQLSNYLTYNQLYYWQVRVWDNKGANSGWVSGNSFRTANHAWPSCDFSWSPESPNAGEEVSFIDQTTFYAAPLSWDWTFQDADPNSSDEQNPVTIFQSIGNKSVTLTATDIDNYSCSVTKTVNISFSLPKWKEIKPW